GWTVIRSGSIVYVKGGTLNLVSVFFNPTWYNGSASFDSILIQSGDLAPTPWGTGKAIIDGGNTRTYGVGFDGQSGAALRGLTLDGLEIRNIAAGGAGSPWDTQTGSACIEFGGNYTTT